MLPPPFNLLELLANRCMSSQMEDRSQAFAAGKRGGSWGQHYLWPVPALRFSLPAAMQLYRTGRKDVGQQGIKNLSRKLDSRAHSRISSSACLGPSRAAIGEYVIK